MLPISPSSTRAECQAVVDLRGGAHVQQGALHVAGPCCVHVQATHQVGLVFLVGQPARCRAGCAALAQRKHAGTARGGGGEGVGVDADEQVGLHAPRFFHRACPGARSNRRRGSERRASGLPPTVVALMRSRSRWATRSTTSFSRVPRGADGAGVFTAVAGVQRHDDDAVGLGGVARPPRAVGRHRRSAPGQARPGRVWRWARVRSRRAGQSGRPAGRPVRRGLAGAAVVSAGRRRGQTPRSRQLARWRRAGARRSGLRSGSTGLRGYRSNTSRCW